MQDQARKSKPTTLMKPNFGAFFLCAAIVSTTLFAGDRGPLYKGRPLSYWLLGYSPIHAQGNPNKGEAIEAVRNSGLDSVRNILEFDGIPFPMRSGVVREALTEFCDSHPDMTNQAYQIVFKTISGTNRVAKINAMEAVPRPMADQALSAIEVLTKSTDPETRWVAFFTIGRCFGTEKAKELGWIAPTNLPSGPSQQELIMRHMRLKERLNQKKQPEQLPAPAVPDT